ncbi:hypothetical protein GUJ93_ZPchr0009g1580 [Zizania palustris]|uniref:Pentatricopeptide repeat-containing protein n=1 Tax=Zizania palustris TaxID=103762 RepID=A0A8J5RNW8_ZIZPA|nr:hypothetical protein GUJ93_ZPchr0009g1580 [Zizania palustris]
MSVTGAPHPLRRAPRPPPTTTTATTPTAEQRNRQDMAAGAQRAGSQARVPPRPPRPPGLLSAAGAVHSHVVKIGSVEDAFVGNALIGAYSRNGGGSWTDARKVFDGMPAQQDVVSWNSAMATSDGAGGRREEVSGARKIFHEMLERDTVSSNTMSDCLQGFGVLEHHVAWRQGARPVSYAQMKQQEFHADAMTLINVLGHGELIKESVDLIKMIPWELT